MTVSYYINTLSFDIYKMKNIVNKIKRNLSRQKIQNKQQEKAEIPSTQPTENKQNIITTTLSFQFLQAIHSKYLNCRICQKLMLQPIRLHPCGHTLCNGCIQHKQVKKCPLCLTNISAKQKDLLCSKLVGELSVKCLNVGCPWKGTFEEYNNFHKSQCKLKEGMDQWLKQLQHTISQNSMGFGGIDQKQKQQEDGDSKNININKDMPPIHENNEQQEQRQQKPLTKINMPIKPDTKSIRDEQLDQQKLEKRIIKKRK